MDYPSNEMGINIDLTTKELSFIAVMTSLCVGSNYLMLSVPNVKFMDLFVFISGYLMGIIPGMLVGFLTWLIYGTLNPYGFQLLIFFATSLSETLYGLAGGLCARYGFKVSGSLSIGDGEFWSSNMKLGIIGFFLTFIYDLITNIASAFMIALPLSRAIIVALVSGIPFALAHETSNLIFFFLCGTVLINTIGKVVSKGGE